MFNTARRYKPSTILRQIRSIHQKPSPSSSKKPEGNMSDNTAPSLIGGRELPFPYNTEDIWQNTLLTELFGGLVDAQWAKGAAVESIGTAINSTPWLESGAKEKEAGLAEMKAAGEQRKEEGGHGAGKAESVLGSAVGCEGMEKEGKASEK